MDVTDAVITAIHLVVGFILVFYAAKAYKKTKYPPMLLLVAGFSILVLGETVIEDFFNFLNDNVIQEIIAESFEIAGFVILILAVKKS
ncbi:MAG: hypothetical protein QXN55_02385 [Candidatus Nitrosotenuis sp.]|jgi:ABC-type spermidine/putrescine transport system permease subunit I